ncbi:hypothetical protein J7F03_21665 [Streptomyces sp. ISL-43]|uniref:DUF6190 family protein n=1 Tax=Streptomyces sp. ISL-43 TaxID=2819183 RepID=UPI001BE58442|nr:DUF6190 family protein [Streptomyces sp. ISL-43]MBT2449641.1 hypothetical protein [Streptomyces sp. ISL-43]
MQSESHPADEYADAALFLGMNSVDEDVRRACKAFFVDRLAGRLVMSLEQVGRCDDIVWGFSRELQDAYYPFMDNLHTVMDIRRLGYDEADVERGTGPEPPRTLPAHERLLLGMVLNRKGLLHTASPRLAATTGFALRVADCADGPEARFPEPLESLYQQSLALRVPAEAL